MSNDRLPVVSFYDLMNVQRKAISPALDPSQGNPVPLDQQSPQLQLVRVDRWIPEKLMIRFTFRDSLVEGATPQRSTASILYNRPVGDVMKIIPPDVQVREEKDPGTGLNSYVPVSDEIIGAVLAINADPKLKYIFLGYLMMMGEDFTGELNDYGDAETAVNELAPGIIDSKLQVLNVRDYGAKGDGVTDDTIPIQSLFNSITEKTSIYFPPGTYKITNTVIVNDKPELDIIGDNTTLLTETTNLQYIISAKNCHNLKMSDIEFDMNNKGKGAVSIVESPNSIIENCYFHDCKYDTGEGYKSMIYLSYSPNVLIRNNVFKNIAQNSHPDENPQYRCISVESGCADLRIENNTFRDICQVLIVFEEPMWKVGESYDTGTYLHHSVNYEVDGVLNQYHCIQAHTSTSEITPLDTEYWEQIHTDISPTTKILFKGNSTYNSRMNGIYFLREVKDIHIIDNYWENITTMQTLTIVGKNAIITGNTFIDNLNPINIRNEADVEKVIVTGNTFHGYNTHALYVMTGMDSSGFKLKNLIFSDNIIIREDTTNYTKLITTKVIDRLIITNNVFKAAAHSEIEIGTSDRVNIEGNIFNTNASTNQPVIRLSGTSNSVMITGNQFKTASSSSTAYYNEASSIVHFKNNTKEGVLQGAIISRGTVQTGAVVAGVDGTVNVTIDEAADFNEVIPWVQGGGTGYVTVSTRAGATFTFKYRFNNDWPGGRTIGWVWIKS